MPGLESVDDLEKEDPGSDRGVLGYGEDIDHLDVGVGIPKYNYGAFYPVEPVAAAPGRLSWHHGRGQEKGKRKAAKEET